MRQRFGWSWAGGAAPVAAFVLALAGRSASAGELAVPKDPGVFAQPCSSAAGSCARIRGYVRAGSDAPSNGASEERSGPIALPPLLAGTPLGALNRDLGFLPVSGDVLAR